MFNDTYRESIQNKHIGNVGFSSTAKGVTNEAYATKNPHQILASQVPAVDVVGTYGPLVASGIAAGLVEKHIVKLTADPTVNGNKAWLAYEANCTETGHSGRPNVRLDQFIRVANTEYKLRVYGDNGSGSGPNTSKEILASETQFNWEYDASAGVLYFDDDPTNYGFTGPLWGEFYLYVGEFLSDKIDTTTSGAPASDTFLNFTDGVNTATASAPDDTFTIHTAGGLSVIVDPTLKMATISGAPVADRLSADLTYNTGIWEYNSGFSAVPSDMDVYYNGVKNKNSDNDYYTATVSGGTLFIDFAFDTYSSDWVNIVYGDEYGAPGLLRNWINKTSAYTLKPGDRVIIDSTGGSFTLTLPSGPNIGDTVSFIDGGDNCNTNNVTIARNGQKIVGLTQDLTIDTDSANFDLVFYNTSQGWRIVE